jgi:hypothetical protein
VLLINTLDILFVLLRNLLVLLDIGIAVVVAIGRRSCHIVYGQVIQQLLFLLDVGYGLNCIGAAAVLVVVSMLVATQLARVVVAVVVLIAASLFLVMEGLGLVYLRVLVVEGVRVALRVNGLVF